MENPIFKKISPELAPKPALKKGIMQVLGNLLNG